MNWDELKIHDWSHAAHPQPFVLSAATTGCGCCADGEVYYSAEDARIVVRQYMLKNGSRNCSNGNSGSTGWKIARRF